MNEKYFLVQIKHTNDAYEKGVVVKDTLDEARQAYHAYLGAYGYGKDKTTDYVACHILDDKGMTFDMAIDDRRPEPEPTPEPTPETEGEENA